MSFGHLPGAFLEIFFWFQKATLGTRLHRNVSRRPWRPSSVFFGDLPGAFQEIFFWFQKATLGTRLHRNVSRRPWRPSSVSFGDLPGAFQEIFFWFQTATLGTRLPRNVSRCPLATCQALSRRIVPLNFSRRPSAALKPFPAPLAAQQHVLAYASFFSSLFQLLCVHGRPAGVLCCTRMRPDAQADHTAAWHRGHVCLCFRVGSAAEGVAL